MKKISLFAMLLMSSFAFSYGYRNTYWGEDELSLIPIPDDSMRPGQWINKYIAICKKWTKTSY